MSKNRATHFSAGRRCAAEWLWRGCSIAVLLAGCSFDDRNPNAGQKDDPNESETSGLGPSSCPPGAECPDGAAGPAPANMAGGSAGACLSDADCLPATPTCVSGQCQCSLSAQALQADADNCGSCGNRCGSGALCENATCKVVDPIVPGSPGTSLTAGGTELRSARYRALVVAGQPPGGNAVLVSPRYRLEGGLIGTTAESTTTLK